MRSLGTFNVKEGNGAIPWDGRNGNGGPVPNGSYVLDLTSTDPQGDRPAPRHRSTWRAAVRVFP